MKVIEISDNQKEHWNSFVKKYSQDGGILQSWQWGEFKKTMGFKIFRLAVVEDDNFLSTALILKHQLPFKQYYLYMPRGPVIDQKNQLQTATILEILFKKIKEIAKSEKSIFLKVEPTHLPADNLINLVFNKSKAILPTETLVLNLRQTEEEILNQMKQKTRYNIRLAEKKGVVIKELSISSSQTLEFDKFWQVMQETSSRQKIKTFDKIYFEKLFDVFSQENLIRLFLAEYNNTIIAANLVAFYGDNVYYLFGGQSDEFREVMAPYLLQWYQILEAKKQKKKYYDFWGVSETKKSWAGITRFKIGFAPDKDFTRYIGAYDYAFNLPAYWIYRLAKKIKR